MPQKSWLGAHASVCSWLLKNTCPMPGSLQFGGLQGSVWKLLFAIGRERESVQSESGLHGGARVDLSSWGAFKGTYQALDLTYHCSQWLRIKLDNRDRIQLAQGFGKKASVCAPAGTSCWFCACCRETLRSGFIDLHPIVGPPSDLVQCPGWHRPGTFSALPCFFRPLLILSWLPEGSGCKSFWGCWLT